MHCKRNSLGRSRPVQTARGAAQPRPVSHHWLIAARHAFSSSVAVASAKRGRRAAGRTASKNLAASWCVVCKASLACFVQNWLTEFPARDILRISPWLICACIKWCSYRDGESQECGQPHICIEQSGASSSTDEELSGNAGSFHLTAAAAVHIYPCHTHTEWIFPKSMST
jgi:hypothetical protein